MLCGPSSPVINGVWKYGVGETIYNNCGCTCRDIWSGICNEHHQCMKNINIDYIVEVVKKYI